MALPPKILQANKDVTLFGEILFVNQILFFTTVSDYVKFTTADHIHTQKMEILTIDIQNVKSI